MTAHSIMTPREGDSGNRPSAEAVNRPLISFPAGQTICEGPHYTEAALREIQGALDEQRCSEGRLDLELLDTRLTCLIHHGRPYLAGLLEGRVHSHVPLAEFPLRSRQLVGASWRLVGTDLSEVMILGVHFARRPALQGSTRWIDIQHVLHGLARDRSDAALAFERGGSRTLVFIHQGAPARIFFADPLDDPGEGSITERLLVHAFDPAVSEGWLEVFTDLKLSPDPDAGRSLTELAEEAQPPPPVDLIVRLGDGRAISDRPFTPPAVTIGRDQRCDLFLDNLAVSRRHASITWERGAFVVRDLGSANGTRVDGKQINSVTVKPGARIEIGKFEITLATPRSAGGVAETMMLATQRAPRPVYLVGESSSREISADLVLGKGLGVDVRAAGLFVRPVHARLQPVAHGVVEVTCFGQARVKVNGQKQATARMSVGDRLTVGRSDFWLRWTPGDARVPKQ